MTRCTASGIGGFLMGKGGALVKAVKGEPTDSEQELAPVEDQSILFVQARGPQTATPEYNEIWARRMVELFQEVPEYEDSFLFLGMGGDNSTVFGGFKMAPPSERERSQMAVTPELQGKLQQVAGFQMAAFPRPSLPGGGRGLPRAAAAGQRRGLPLQDPRPPARPQCR